jgi:hypothetical protein
MRKRAAVVSIFRDALFILLAIAPMAPGAGAVDHYDAAIYGGTSGGVIAAVQLARLGKHVVLIVPEKNVGGLTSGGLGWTDVGNPDMVGGLSREFYHRIYLYYQDDANWKHGSKAQFASAPGQHTKAVDQKDQVMWVFEPKAAARVYQDMLSEARVTVVKNERLNRTSGVSKTGAHITSIKMESGQTFAAAVFLDTSYEGDLLAAAGVSYAVGREGNDVYGETINGIEVAKAVKNQLPKGVDAYVVKGDPSSGLLPGVNPNPGGKDGTGDSRIQAYCYRMCLTDIPQNRVMIEKPAGYNEKDFELLFRCIEAGQKDGFFKFDMMPNHKTDSNNASGMSTDFIGMNYAYPEEDYEQREKFAAAQELWQRGLLWSLQNHPRVPEAIRANYAKWGLPKDEFEDNGHWPTQLYIREARRMKGMTIATERTLMENSAEYSIGMGVYAIDSHAVQRYADAAGTVHNEGDVQIKPPGPYRIDYDCIVPKAAECDNLIVPVCLSASHVAYGSIRMEPVFMVLGHSAADAANIAIEKHESVQQVSYEELRKELLAEHQVLSK